MTYQKNEFWISKKLRKKSFSFYYFLEIGWYFILNKKNEKMSVLFIFFEKNIFECQTKSGKKNDMSGIKKCCWKNDDVENEKSFPGYKKYLFE